MSIILHGILLSPDLIWMDEFTASCVAQSVRRTIDGGVVTMATPRRYGHPITLQSAADAGLLTRETVQAVALLAEEPGAVYVLTLRGVSRAVMFRHDDAPALEARPLIHLAYPAAGHWYAVTIKLMTV
jgi:hypothetical protein